MPKVRPRTVDIVFEAFALGTPDEVFTHSVSIYPNPVTAGQFAIRLPKAIDQIAVSVSNVLGQQVWSDSPAISSNTAVVTFENVLPSGMYTVTVSNGKQKAVRKIIVK
jgi:hypothetical protein